MFVYAGQWMSRLQRIGTPHSKISVDTNVALEFLKLFTKEGLPNSLDYKWGYYYLKEQEWS